MSPADVLAWLTALLFAAVALDGVRLWRQRRSAPAGWVLTAFGSLAGAIVARRVIQLFPEVEQHPVGKALGVVILLAVIAFPYLLYRFSEALDPERDRWLPPLTAIAVVMAAASAVLAPFLPEQGETAPLWYLAYVVVVLAYWTLFAVLVASRLWRAGRNQPSVARRRMRMLALASLVLNVGLVVAASGTGADSESTLLPVLTQAIAGLSAALFGVGLSPPAGLRALWRRPEGRRLREAERELMAANSGGEIAAGLLPPLTQLLGGRDSALYAADGRMLGVQGKAPAPPAIPEGAELPFVGFAGLDLVMHFENGTAVVTTSPYTPFFGEDEAELAESLATLVDLALGRVDLLDRERRAWTQLEQANDELQTLLYGLSHDLRNPLLTMLGYVDLLTQGRGGTLSEDGRMFTDRIARSARYMDSLIRDLLELSRVGRIHTQPEDIDLTRLVREIVEEVAHEHPAMTFTVHGLGGISMSPVRARQLFTNLLQNAALHAGREDLSVTVRSEPGEDGSLVVSVADDGVGVPVEYRERLFGMFERMETGSGPGTGIGLAICKRIMEHLGGTIGLVDADEGTDVRLYFPSRVVLDRAAMESNV